jgi:hypothetical protein
LHGAVSHLAIRRHIYGNDNPMAVQEVLRLHVRSFIGGLGAVLKRSNLEPGKGCRQLTINAL